MRKISILTLSLLLSDSYCLYFNPVGQGQVSSKVLCSGTYYESLNSLFVDCFDSHNQLVSEDQSFFEYSLDQTCNTKAWSDIKSSFMDWIIPAAVLDDTQVTCCDYYQRTVGYVFTQCDNNINAVILSDRAQSDESSQYQQMSTEYKYLDWNWSELEQLIKAYCQYQSGTTQTNGTSGSGTESVSMLSQIWHKLDLPWQDWLVLANNNSNFTTWDKATWKQWILIYEQVTNAVNNYTASQNIPPTIMHPAVAIDNFTLPNATQVTTSTLNNATTATETTTSSSTSAISNEANSNLNNSILNATFSTNLPNATIVTTNNNQTTLPVATGVAAPVTYWQAAWDDASFTVDDLIAAMKATTLYTDFISFFFDAFGTNGFVAGNQAQATMSNATQSLNNSMVVTPPVAAQSMSGFPMGMDAIIQWISQNVDREVRQNCSACAQMISNITISNITNQTNISLPTNITNITMPENSTAITNETVPVTGSGSVISSDTYVLPDQCSYSDDTNTKVCCDKTDLNQKSCFTFDEINNWFADDANIGLTCTNFQADDANCIQNDSADTPMADCIKSGEWNFFNNQGWGDMYGFFAADSSNQLNLFNTCLSRMGADQFTGSQSDFKTAFSFGFGDITGNGQ